MSNTILIKRSGTANAIPSSGNLSLGELAINYTDGKLFYKDAGGTVKVIASNQTFTLSGNISAGNISTGGLITATGNINGGNINTANIVSAGGNVIAGNINTVGKANVGSLTVVGTTNLGNVGNVTITGGSSGYLLTTDGAGNLSWSATAGTTEIFNGNSNVTIPDLNGNVYINANSGTDQQWNFATSGNLVLPLGGIISESSSPTGVGNNITLTPSGGSNVNQQLLIYPTITEGDHLHLTTGNLAVTSLFLGNDIQYIRTNTDGSMVIGTDDSQPDIPGYGYRWVFDANGNLTAPSTGTANLGNLATANYANFTNDVYVSGSANIAVNLVVQGNIANANNIFATNSITSGTATVNGNLTSGNANLGNLATANNFSTNGSGGDITLTGGNIVGGNVVFANSFTSNGGLVDFNTNNANVQLGSNANVHLYGGSTGQVLQTDGAGNLTWYSISATTIQNGNSNVTIPDLNGNIYVNANAGSDQQWVFSTNGNLTAPAAGTANLGNLVTANYANFNNDLDVGGNIVTGTGSGGNISGVDYLTANVVNTGSLSATGNAIIGNISSAGNITGANVIAITAVDTGNINHATAISITATTGNINLSPTSGNIVLANSYINGVAYPAQDQDAASKLYVDNMASTGLLFHTAVVAATDTTLASATGGTVSYSQPNGVANGVGALLTTTGSFYLIDTANVQTVGTRILVKNEANATWNGVYTYANTTNLIRSTDADTYGSAPNTLSLNDYFFVQSGNVNAGSAYVVSAPPGTITFGTSNITFAQFSSSQTYSANTAAGLVLIGQTFNAKVDNTTTAFDGGGNIVVKASANLTTPNIGAATGTSLSLSGNVVAGNLDTGSGVIVTTGNITGGNLAAGSGVIVTTGNITGGNLLFGTGQVSGTGNISGGNLTVGSGSGGSITGANLISANIFSATGNITGGNVLFGSGIVSGTGNITGGNLLFGTGIVSGTGNVTAGNVLFGTGQVSGAGNIAAGNITTAGLANVANLIVYTFANVTSTTVSNDTTSGALVVAGGVGVAGNIYAGAMYVGTDSVLTVNSTVDGGTY